MSKKHLLSGREAGQPSQRQLRVGEMLRHALAELLERADFRDPDLVGVPVTVTEVRPAPDMRSAVAYVMPLGGTRVETVIAALNRAAPYLRRGVAERVEMKFLPEIRFVADTTFDQASRIDALLRSPDVARDLSASPEDDSKDGA